MSTNDDSKRHTPNWERELDHTNERLKRLESLAESDKSIVVDLQVRIAQLEIIEPIGKDEFEPIRRLVWGFVGTVLAVVLIAVLAIIINRSGAVVTLKPI